MKFIKDMLREWLGINEMEHQQQVERDGRKLAALESARAVLQDAMTGDPAPDRMRVYVGFGSPETVSVDDIRREFRDAIKQAVAKEASSIRCESTKLSREQTAAQVATALEHVGSEKFLDDMIDRIKRKQINT